MNSNIARFLTPAFVAAALCAASPAQAEETPIITFKTNIYDTYGASNKFHIVLGSTETDYFDIDCGFGMVEAEVSPAYFDDEAQAIMGTVIPCVVSQDGIVRIYGDPSKIDYIDCEGCYIDWIEMPELSNLQIIDLSHNELKRLDLTPFEKLYAIYLSDNPFTVETPPVIGRNHPDLTILELDIVDHVDQEMNLSDYPSLQVFDGYHATDLRHVDVTGCPELRELSLEMSAVESVDVSKNRKLTRLNTCESRVRTLDLSHNPELLYLLCGHSSGFVNTDVKMDELDVTNNTKLVYLAAQANNFTSIDLSKNPNLGFLMLQDNNLSDIDLSNNKNLYSVDLSKNNFSFATLPAPDINWEYYYFGQRCDVERSYEVEKPIDFSAKVVRPGSVTSARVFTSPYDGQDVELDPSLYTFENGILTFNQVPTDSVYVKFANSIFEEYTIDSGKFKIKTAEEMGQPSDVLSITVGAARQSDEFAFKVGVDASVSGSGVFYVDVQVEDVTTRHTFTASSITAPADNNVSLTLPAATAVTVRVLMPESTIMTALEIAGYPCVESVDLTRATELRTLSITGCELSDIDLRYNRCLTDLDLSDNDLTSLNLKGVFGNYEKYVLGNIKASNNRIASLTVAAVQPMRRLDLSNNCLETMSLKDFDNLLELNLSRNMLSETADLSYLTSATDIDLSYNRYDAVTGYDLPAAKSLNLSNNLLTIATLPYLTGIAEYTYAPQASIEIVNPAPAVNISDQNRDIDGQLTSFVWKNVADGTPLVEGVDMEMTGGATRFLPAAIGKEVYCELSHPAFPQFSGENLLTTTATRVVDVPVNVVASFTTTASRNDGEVIFRGHKNTALYIDWRGDGSEYKQYPVSADTYIDYPDQKTYEGANVKIYTYGDAADISVFSIYNVPMTGLDASPLSGVYSFSIGSCGIDEDNIKFPATTALKELTLSNNNFSTKDFSEYTLLTNLNLARNNYTEFDAGKIPSLETLAIELNKLTELKLNNPSMWGLSAGYNNLSEMDFSNVKNLTQLHLPGNKFSTIDVKPLARRLVVLGIEDNYFTFATLPRISVMPALMYYTYGNQAEVEIECVDGVVDLSSQAKIDGIATQFDWYLGDITYDEENGLIIGELLDGTGDDPEYTLENGVTTFRYPFVDTVRCIMTNPNFPKLTLYTNAVKVDRVPGGVENVTADGEAPDAPVDVYTIAGVKIRSQVSVAEATRGLAPGLYIVGGRKVAVR